MTPVDGGWSSVRIAHIWHVTAHSLTSAGGTDRERVNNQDDNNCSQVIY